MGMDIYGLDPKAERKQFEDRMEEILYEIENGIYFRASGGSWSSILNSCKLASNYKNLNIDFKYWDYNDDAGLYSQEECDKLADALDEIFETLTEINSNHLKHFITFLRNCGGFRIN